MINNSVRLLCVDKGLGFSKKQYLQHKNRSGTNLNVEFVCVPEPTQTSGALSEEPEFKQGVQNIREAIDRFKPNVLLAASRGGKYAIEVLDLGIWRGATLLLCPMLHKKVIPNGIPVTIVHGASDITIPIESVREVAETGTPGLVKLIEVQDNHSLSSIEEETCGNERNLFCLLDSVFKMSQDMEYIERQLKLQKEQEPTTTSRAAMRQSLFSGIQARRK